MTKFSDWMPRNFVEESKDRFILKNNNLTPEEKDELINHLRKYKYKESMINWNNFDEYDWNDVNDVIRHQSNTQKRKIVTSGQDYIPVNVKSNDNMFLGAYIPQTFKGMKVLASKNVGGIRAKWSPAYSPEYYNQYINEGYNLVVFVYRDSKYGLLISPDGSTDVYDEDDRNLGSNFNLPGIGSQRDFVRKYL